MTFLPIVARELRVAARRRSTFYFRVVAVLMGLTVLLWIMIFPELRTPQRLGIALFTGLSVAAFVYAVVIGIFTTADCVSEEKREGTLGLLFLTDLKGYDIVLGKLVATSLNAVYGLLAIFPIMAIPLLAGGVTGSEFWRVLLVALNSIFFSLAMGMMISAITRDDRVAMTLTFFLLLFLTGGLPLIGAFATDWTTRSLMSPLFYLLSPGFTCLTAFDVTYNSPLTSQHLYFYTSFLCVHVLGWLFLVLACFIMPRTWQDKVTATSRGLERWQQWRFGSPETRLALRRLLLPLNPFRWLTSRERSKSILVWIFLGFMGVLWLWGWFVYKHDWSGIALYLATGLILQTMLKWWLTNEACRQFGQDRRSGALELILSTPLSVREIVDGQLMALWRQFAGPVAVILALDFLFLMAEREENLWVLVCVAGMSVFVADLITLAWVGMWLGLNARNVHRAVAATAVRVLILPWMLFGLFMTVLMLLATTSAYGFPVRWLGEWSDKKMVLTWLLIALLVDVVFCLWARHRLLRDFRSVATRQYESRRAAPVGPVPPLKAGVGTKTR